MSRPLWGQADRPGVPRMLGGIWGGILSELKEYTPRPPEEKFWEGFRFPSQTLLKTTKGGQGPLWKPLFGDGRGCFLRWDGGRERRKSKAGCVRSFRAFCLVGDEVGEGLVVLAPTLGG